MVNTILTKYKVAACVFCVFTKKINEALRCCILTYFRSRSMEQREVFIRPLGVAILTSLICYRSHKKLYLFCTLLYVFNNFLHFQCSKENLSLLYKDSSATNLLTLEERFKINKKCCHTLRYQATRL